MKWIVKLIKWMLLLILGIVLIFLLNIAWHRLRGPSEEERSALAIVDVPVEMPQGRNAFAMTWLFAKDVDDADIERLAAIDVEYAKTHKQLNGDEQKFPSAELPGLDEPKSNSPALCSSTPEDCLAVVRKSPESTRALLAAHDQLLQRAASLEDYDFLYNEFPPVLGMPSTHAVYNLLSQRLRISQLALMFEDGSHSDALAGVCSNLSMWRRFGTDNRSMIQTMLAVSRRDAAIELFASMLAELKPGETLPAECSAALVPLAADEVSLCSSMLGEFDYADEVFGSMSATAPVDEQKGWLETNAQPLLFDVSRTRAWRATKTAPFCEPDVAMQLLQDQSFELPTLEIDWFDCQANMIGCILVRVASPGYIDYVERLLDSAAHLRLAATLAWLHETGDSGQSLQQRFDSRPDALRSGSRASGISEDGGEIWVDNRHSKRAVRFSLPLSDTGKQSP